MKKMATDQLNKALKYVKPLSIAVLFICFVLAAYSMQTQQATDLNDANKRVQDLELDQALAIQALKQQSVNNPLNPYAEVITTVNTSVNVTVISSKRIGPSITRYIGGNGYLIFAQKDKALLELQLSNITAQETGGDQITYSGSSNNMITREESLNQPVLFLKQAENVVIGFPNIPTSCLVGGGDVSIVINNKIPIKFAIPHQQITSNIIFVPNIQQYLSDFKE